MVQVALVTVHAMPLALACLFGVGGAVSLWVVTVAHALVRTWLAKQWPAGRLHGQRDQDDPRDGECHCGHVRPGEPLIQQ